MTTEAKIPVVHVEVSLDEFDSDEMAEHLRRRGFVVEEGNGPRCDSDFVVAATDMTQIYSLALSGLREPARDLLCRLASEHLGRDI